MQAHVQCPLKFVYFDATWNILGEVCPLSVFPEETFALWSSLQLALEFFMQSTKTPRDKGSCPGAVSGGSSGGEGRGGMLQAVVSGERPRMRRKGVQHSGNLPHPDDRVRTTHVRLLRTTDPGISIEW